MSTGPLKTRWFVNEDLDIIRELEGRLEWRQIAVRCGDFPGATKYTLDRIATLMNIAFDAGVKAKAQQFREVLGAR